MKYIIDKDCFQVRLKFRGAVANDLKSGGPKVGPPKQKESPK